MSGEPHAGHERLMAAALAFGRRSMGRAAPNPSVGALVVKDGAVLGRGVTAPGGRPHAEPEALRQAGVNAQGATLYVTLEPCSHVGQTPPCVDVILAARVATVVFALLDPDPRVAGRGIERLRKAGVEVIGPVLESEARRDHLGHCLRVTQGRPAVTVKMAETADGYAARLPPGERLLITGPLANAHVHGLRALHDAILVGRETVEADDPRLTVRLPGVARHPSRVVLDSNLALSPRAALLKTIAEAPLFVVAAEEADHQRAAQLEARGVTVVRVPRLPRGLDLGAVLAALGRLGFTRIFCEGGPRLASALIAEGWADVVTMISSPIGLETAGLDALDARARRMLADRVVFEPVDDVLLGADRLRSYERRETACSPDL